MQVNQRWQSASAVQPRQATCPMAHGAYPDDEAHFMSALGCLLGDESGGDAAFFSDSDPALQGEWAPVLESSQSDPFELSTAGCYPAMVVSQHAQQVQQQQPQQHALTTSSNSQAPGPLDAVKISLRPSHKHNDFSAAMQALPMIDVPPAAPFAAPFGALAWPQQQPQQQPGPTSECWRPSAAADVQSLDSGSSGGLVSASVHPGPAVASARCRPRTAAPIPPDLSILAPLASRQHAVR